MSPSTIGRSPRLARRACLAAMSSAARRQRCERARWTGSKRRARRCDAAGKAAWRRLTSMSAAAVLQQRCGLRCADFSTFLALFNYAGTKKSLARLRLLTGESLAVRGPLRFDAFTLIV